MLARGSPPVDLKARYLPGLTAFVIVLAPASALAFHGSCVADRFLYFPLFFLLLPLAQLLRGAEQRFRRSPAWFFLPLAVVALPLWVLTSVQERTWHDSKSLWTHVARVVPLLPKAHANLALIALDEEDFGTALDHAEKANELEPTNSAFMHVLGRAYIRRGLAAKAAPLIEQALKTGLGPNQASGQMALAEARICLADESGANSAVQEAIKSGYAADKAFADVGDAARLYAARYDLAEEYYRKAIDAAPDEVIYLWKDAGVLEYLGRFGEALAQCEKALRLSTRQGQPVPQSLQKAVERLRQRATHPATQPENR
jgi:tetratricopeptide (TPR) repeat protein